MNNLLNSSPIMGIKSKNFKFLQVSDGFAKMCQYLSSDDVHGLTDYEVAKHAFSTPDYTPNKIAEEIMFEDEQAMNGKHIFILDVLFIHGKLNYYLVHKSPYQQLNNIEGSIFHAIPLGDVSSTEIKNYLSNPSIHLSGHTKSNLATCELAPARKYDFTPRQWQCLKLLAKGCSAKEIAYRLHISSKTAEFHIGNIK